MNIISLRNVNLKYQEKDIFKDLNVEIKEGDFITIIGENASGKTSLVKILLGLVEAQGEIIIDGMKMTPESRRNIISKIGVVFENPDDQFLTGTVREELAFPLENMKVSKEEISARINQISEFTNIKDILDREPHTLSGGEKQLVSLSTALIINPKILILDESLSMIDNFYREKIYKILKKLNEKNKMTIINVTHDIEEVIYGKSILILSKGEIIDYSSTRKVLQNGKQLESLGLDIPFMVDLSNKLKYYDLVDKMYLNMKDMVDDLWK